MDWDDEMTLWTAVAVGFLVLLGGGALLWWRARRTRMSPR
jgi:LPXTG-motif cell wall-anchored protein